MLPLLLAFALLQATPTQPPSAPPATPATPSPVEDPAVTALARKIYGQMRAGKVDDALLTPAMAAALTEAKMKEMQPLFDQLGDPTALKLEERASSNDGVAWQYLATFATAQLHVRIFITPAGKVGGYVLAP